jgi:hypothetical protein
MNSSLISADGTTHLKILVISLLASIFVVWVGISGRSTATNSSSEDQRIERPVSRPADLPVGPRIIEKSALT